MCSRVALFIPMLRIRFFTIPWPKVPLSFPAPKRECGIFGPSIMKNRIRNMGIKKATPRIMPSSAPEHMFTRALDWPTLYLPCCVIYYFIIPGPKILHSCFGAGSESATFPPCSETGMWCYRPGYGEK